MKTKQLCIVFGLGVGLIFVALLSLSPNVVSVIYAAEFTVTRTDDPMPDGCQVSDCSLREAIIAANTAGGGDTINLSAGTYTLSITGTGENAALSGDLDVTDDLTITGMGIDTTIINGAGIDRVFHITGTGHITFSGLTIQNGVITTSAAGSAEGGAINYNVLSGSINIINSKIFSNTAGQDGGGIHIESDLTTVVISNSQVVSNTAIEFDGGGLDTEALTVTLEIIASSFNDNIAGDNGGAVDHDEQNALLKIVQSDFIQNTANSDGGALNFDEGNIILSIVESNFYSNTSGIANDSSDGGAFNVEDEFAVISISGSNFVSNTATREGGAFHLDDTSYTIAITDSLFEKNVARRGGAINYEGVTTTARITNSRFIDNVAMEEGGAFRTDDDNAIVSIDGSVFINNRSNGVGVDNGGGAIVLEDTNTVMTITQSSFDRNSSAFNGGAIEVQGNPTFLRIVDSSLTNNNAFTNGGAINFDSDGGSLVLINSTTSGNDAGQHGAGIAISGTITSTVFPPSVSDTLVTPLLRTPRASQSDEPDDEDDTDEDDGTKAYDQPSVQGRLLQQTQLLAGVPTTTTFTAIVTFNSATIAGNVADRNNDGNGDGGGLWISPIYSATVNIANTLLVGNTDRGGEAPQCANLDDIVSAGYNLVREDTGCNWSAATGDLVGSSGSPVLGMLNGLTGSPAYHMPKLESPAINGGNPATPGNPFPACVATDQRGVTRPQGASCDIGAIEAHLPELSISKTGPATVDTGQPISYTITVTNTGVVTATDLTITDTIPANANYVSGSGGIQVGNVISFTGSMLPANGGQVQVTFAVTASETVTNSDYSVTSLGGFGATGNIAVVTSVMEADSMIYLPFIMK